MDLHGLSTVELHERLKDELADKPGECCCPVFDNRTRGFRRSCPVHGGWSREDFRRITELRGELFSRLRAPASVRQTR